MSIRSVVLDHPAPLVWLWEALSRLLRALPGAFRRLGIERSSRWVGVVEHPLKRAVFGCRECGQCVLHTTGMTCPMTCPKELRNGPCGGVCRDGKCEADPEMDCVWVQAIERAGRTRYALDVHLVNPAPDWRRRGRSSWVGYALEANEPLAGGGETPLSALDVLQPPGAP